MQDKMCGSGNASLADTIVSYWDGRAQTYSNGVGDELADDRHCAWQRFALGAAREVLDAARAEGRVPRVADLGCGPGFFSVLFAEVDCAVDAVDMSPAMLFQAQENVSASVPGARVAFHECDLHELPFEDDSFDICISRNVTWLMRDPEGAYAEWLRVLRPGGKLITFDANWYRYLVDPELDVVRRGDQEGNDFDGLADDSRATADEERRCELIAAELPLTPIMRPAWDLDALGRLGVDWVRADEGAWRHVWTEHEQSYYRTSPLFMIEAVK